MKQLCFKDLCSYGGGGVAIFCIHLSEILLNTSRNYA